MICEINKDYSGISANIFRSLKDGGIRRVTSRGKLLCPGSDFLRLERDYRAPAARSEN